MKIRNLKLTSIFIMLLAMLACIVSFVAIRFSIDTAEAATTTPYRMVLYAYYEQTEAPLQVQITTKSSGTTSTNIYGLNNGSFGFLDYQDSANSTTIKSFIPPDGKSFFYFSLSLYSSNDFSESNLINIWENIEGTDALNNAISHIQNNGGGLFYAKLYVYFSPKFTAQGVQRSGEHTRNDVKVFWDTDDTATLDESVPYSKGDVVSSEGVHYITIQKGAGTARFAFTIDKTPPTGTLYGVTDGGKTNGSVRLNWTEYGATATFDGTAYTKNSVINATEGIHYFDLSDYIGNSQRYSFTVDKTPPSISMYRSDNNANIPDGTLLNCYPYFNVSASDTASVTISGNSASYDWKTISSQTVYYDNREASNARKYYSTRSELVAALENKERAINLIAATGYSNSEASHIYSSEIDYAYLGSNYYKYYYTNNGTSGDYYIFFNDNVRDSFISNNITKYISSTNKALFMHEGTYTIRAYDDVGNYSEKHFTVDLTPPTSGVLNGVSNNGKTRNDVSFSWGSDASRATLNGSPYSSNQTISDNGKYTIVLYDAVGNYTTYTFEIDKIAPNGNLSGVTNGGRTRGNVALTWAETTATATLNGTNYESGTVIYNEGEYTIVLTDSVGNSSTYSFTIDKTPPTGTLSGVTNGGKTNGNVTFTWTDPFATAQLNKVGYTKNSLITNEGNYTITLTDDVGNSSTYSFTIDKTPPTGTLSGVTNGGKTNGNVTFSWREIGATATLDGVAYISGQNINANGAHTIVLTDDVGNSSTYSFTIDRTPPTGELHGVTNGGKTRSTVLFVWSEDTAYATLNGYEYKSSTEIIEEGEYTIVLTDSVGNSSTYSFTIDKTPPTGILSGVSNNGRTNQDVSFSWTEESATATLNLAPYSKNNLIRIEGQHIIILTDDVGNSSTYSFTIDKTPPTGNFSVEGNLVNSIYYFNSNVSFNCQEESAYAEILNNRVTSTYNFGTDITVDGDYQITLFDDCNNSVTYHFIIDTVAFTDNFVYLQKNYKSNISAWFETYNYRLSNQNNYVADKAFSFTNYTDCFKYAYNRERATIESDTYEGGNITCKYNGQTITVYDVASLTSYRGQKYYIYKSNDNPSILKAYFNVANLEQALSRYAQISITNKYIPDTPATPFEGDANIPAQPVMRDLIFINNANFKLPYSQSNGYLYLNGRLADYGSYLSEGLNYIQEIDYAGNTISYDVILDTQAPRFMCSDTLNNALPLYENQLNNEQQSTFYFSKEIVLSLVDNYDETCLLIIRHNGNSTYVINNSFTCTESGLYSFSIHDIAGNTRSGNIYVSIEEPEIVITENLDTTKRLESFNINIDLINNFVQLSAIEVYVKTEDSDYVQLLRDNDNTDIGINKLKYLFMTNGDYKIIISDNYGRTVTREYSFVKAAPVGTLYLRGGTVVVDRAVVNTDVYFAWQDSTCFAYYSFNGGEEQPYTMRDYISLDGEYVFYLRDAGDNQSIYRITIDTVKPVGQLYYLSENVKYTLQNGGKTNCNVYFTYDEEKEVGASVRYTIDGSDTWLSYDGEALTLNGKYIVQLSDIAGNVASYNFEIDTIPPEIFIKDSMGNLLSSNIVTNQSIKFTWDDLNCTALLNNVNYTKNRTVFEDGDYLLQLTDDCGNFSICYITIDTVAPVGVLSGVANGGRTNQDVSFSWTEESVTATLNGVEYKSNTIISEEGSFTLILQDVAHNTTSYTFTIDKTAPVGDLTGVVNGGITNNNVSFTWTKINSTATLDGVAYSRRAIIVLEGYHIIVLTDDVGNSSTYTFTIDKTAPIGELVGVENGGITNSTVSFVWEEEGATATLNGVNYVSGSQLDAIGTYNIILTDTANNTTRYTFEIAKTLPVGVLTGVENGGRTNGSVSFTWSEFNATATLDGVAYSRRTIIVDEGFHTIILTSIAGNISTFTFTIDKTAPVGDLTGVENGGRTNGSVIFAWTEEGATATLDGANLLSGSEISNEGTHIIVLTDDVGNNSTFTFTIDKTAPVGTLNGVVNNGHTNGNVYLTWREAEITALLNGEAYEKNTILTQEGEYSITLTDDVGNSSVYSFIIDRIAPIGELHGVTLNGYTNDAVTFTWTEEGASATLDGSEYINGTYISTEGAHTIVLRDLAGNTSSYKFVIDLSLPEVIFSSEYKTIDEILYFNTDFYFNFDIQFEAYLNDQLYAPKTYISEEGQYEILVSNPAGSSITVTVILDKTAPVGLLTGVENGGRTNDTILFTWSEPTAIATINDVEYIRDTLISEEGTYTILLSDEVGNSSTYTFTIDKTAPVGELIGVKNEGRTKDNVSFVWEEITATATLNGNAYIKNTPINTTGKHTIILTDDVGNSTLYSFQIVKTLPVATLINVLNGERTNQDVYINWEGNYEGLLDDFVYKQLTAITTEGNHTFILTDDVGNSSTYSFTIDKTPPTGILAGVENDGKTNGNVSFTWNEVGALATLNDIEYKKGSLISIEGEYTIVLTDDVGNSSLYTFVIDRTLPIGELAGVKNGGITNATVSFTWTEKGATATLNGEDYESETEIIEEGSYTLILYDDVGNSSTYTFIIDKTAPLGVLTGVENEGITNSSVSFTWDDIAATATLNGEKYAKRSIITTDGNYEIILTDTAGNYSIYTFIISTVSPTGILTGVENEGATNTDVVFEWEIENATATLNGEDYESGTVISDEGKHKILLIDSAGNSTIYTFTIDKTAPTISGIENLAKTNQSVKLSWNESNCSVKVTLSSFEPGAEPIDVVYQKNYYLSDSGIYVVTVTDEVGNACSISFEIKKYISPISIQYSEKEKDTSIEIKNNNSYTLYSKFKVVSSDVILNNDAEYISNTEMTELGTYNFTITDEYGNLVSFKVVYTDEKTPSIANSTSSIVPNVLLIVIAVLAVIAIVTRIIVSCTKKKRKLKT